MIAIFSFVFLVLFMMLLPLVPAWYEWWRPTDAKPLNVVRNYDGSVTHFAVSFRRFVEERMGVSLRQSIDDPDAVIEGATARGEKFVVVGSGRHAIGLDRLEMRKKETDRVLVGAGDLTLPEATVMGGEVYALGSIRVGARSACRAVLAEQDLHFASGAAVLRWAHAEGCVDTAQGARLWGRVSAGSRIVLGAGTAFSRLHAPAVLSHARSTQPSDSHAIAAPTRRRYDLRRASLPHGALVRPDKILFDREDRLVIRGLLHVPVQTLHRGDLIVTGNLVVGQASHLSGSIKSHRAVTIEDAVDIEGSVVSRRLLSIGQDVFIGGPIVGESVVEIGAGSVIGSPERPTTVTAPTIRLGLGVTIYGTVWARETGLVLGEEPTAEATADQVIA